MQNPGAWSSFLPQTVLGQTDCLEFKKKLLITQALQQHETNFNFLSAVMIQAETCLAAFKKIELWMYFLFLFSFHCLKCKPDRMC